MADENKEQKQTAESYRYEAAKDTGLHGAKDYQNVNADSHTLGGHSKVDQAAILKRAEQDQEEQVRIQNEEVARAAEDARTQDGQQQWQQDDQLNFDRDLGAEARWGIIMITLNAITLGGFSRDGSVDLSDLRETLGFEPNDSEVALIQDELEQENIQLTDSHQYNADEPEFDADQYVSYADENVRTEAEIEAARKAEQQERLIDAIAQHKIEQNLQNANKPSSPSFGGNNGGMMS